MLTVSQVAKKARVSPNTVRYHVRDYPDLFSEAARGLHGNRLFNDEDVAAFCSLVALKNSGMPLAEAAQRIRGQESPPVIDVAATPLQSPASTLQPQKTALEAAFAIQQVQSSLQAQIDALRATQTVLLRAAVLWGALWGSIWTLTVGAFVLWLLWLLAGMQ